MRRILLLLFSVASCATIPEAVHRCKLEQAYSKGYHAGKAAKCNNADRPGLPQKSGVQCAR